MVEILFLKPVLGAEVDELAAGKVYQKYTKSIPKSRKSKKLPVKLKKTCTKNFFRKVALVALVALTMAKKARHDAICAVKESL